MPNYLSGICSGPDSAIKCVVLKKSSFKKLKKFLGPKCVHLQKQGLI